MNDFSEFRLTAPIVGCRSNYMEYIFRNGQLQRRDGLVTTEQNANFEPFRLQSGCSIRSISFYIGPASDMISANVIFL